MIGFAEGTDEYFNWLSTLAPEGLSLLARQPDLPLAVRRDIVMMSQTSPETLDVLADGLDLSSKVQIARRPDALRSTLDRLAITTSATLMITILRNTGTGPSGKTIAYLATSSNTIVQELAITHRNAPKRLIELSLNSDDPAIRTCVVYNPRLTARELEWLAKDEDERVSKAAKERLCCVLGGSLDRQPSSQKADTKFLTAQNR